MARPVKNTVEYFPHFANLRNHRKVKALRSRFGLRLGLAFWSLMLEWLIEHDGLEWEYSDIEVEMISTELEVSAAEMREMVDYCVKLELLSLTDSGFIYSESLNENLQGVFDKRQRERERSKTRARREDGTFAPIESTKQGVSAAETPESKVKESKVNNSKEEKKRKTIVFVPPSDFDITSYVVEKYSVSELAASKFAEKFITHYSGVGWKVGKGSSATKMKDWKRSVNGQWKDTVFECANKYPKESPAPPTRPKYINPSLNRSK